MDLPGDLLDAVLTPLRKRKLDDHIEQGRAWKVQELAEDHDIDQGYIEDRAKERFTDILHYTSKDQAAYARDMGLDRDWAREQAKDWVEDYIEQASRGAMTRDRYVGHHMRVFNIEEDELETEEDLQFHAYAPDRTASEELADAILQYREQSAVDSFADLDSPRYAYADPDEVRDRIEDRAEDAADGEFQARLPEYEDGPAPSDVYERLGMEWAATEELDAYIESFWEPDDEEPELMRIDIDT
jgi:hypothetical protein